jgi:hypothetical protein
MKPVFIKYRNFGQNLINNNFLIYSEKGPAVPGELNSDDILDGTIIQVQKDSSKVFILSKVYDLIASGNANPQISGLKFYKTDLVFNSNPIYYDQTNTYAIYKLQTLNQWFLSPTGIINATGLDTMNSGSGFLKTGESLNPVGDYLSPLDNKSINIQIVDNKLYVYNTPGISGFAGTYTSGTFIIGGLSTVGFQNDQNPDFYIYKNNSPNVWRAVQELNGEAFTWYSRTENQEESEDSNEYPLVYGWDLGDNSVASPNIVSSNALPLPEINFGNCPGNTFDYATYVYEGFSSDPSINRLEFYSGGMLTSSGTSHLFSESLNEMFPDLYNAYFDKQFFYTNIKNGNRFLLFKNYKINNTKILDSWYIVQSPSSYEGDNYYYWASQDNDMTRDLSNYYDSARKIYKPYGSKVNNLKNITINPNVIYSNAGSPYEKDFNLQNFSGEIIIRTTGNNFVNSAYQLKSITGNQYDGLTALHGKYHIFASPKFGISGVTCGNLPFAIINPSSVSVFNNSGRVEFVKATEGFQYEVQFTRNLSSGWNATGVTLIESLNQSSVPSGFIRKEFYFSLSELDAGNLFFRMSGTPAVWTVLDSEYNFLGIRNCYTQSNILPSKYWFTGEWSSNSIAFANSYTYEIIPVYKHNEYINNSKLLALDTNYDYTQVSGIFNLDTGDNFTFQFFNDKPLTGYIANKNSSQEFNGFINESFDNLFYGSSISGIDNITIENKSKNIIYSIFKSGDTSILSKMPYSQYYKLCKFD